MANCSVQNSFHARFERGSNAMEVQSRGQNSSLEIKNTYPGVLKLINGLEKIDVTKSYDDELIGKIFLGRVILKAPSWSKGIQYWSMFMLPHEAAKNV